MSKEANLQTNAGPEDRQVDGGGKLEAENNCQDGEIGRKTEAAGQFSEQQLLGELKMECGLTMLEEITNATIVCLHLQSIRQTPNASASCETQRNR